MKRREFIAATLALFVPQDLRAQATPRRLGLLTNFESPDIDAWRSGLRDHGWIEGKNLIVDYRYFEGRTERIPALAAELVALKPDLLVGSNPIVAAALKSVTTIIPIVFVAVADPVGIGLVQSLSRPGGNITGIATFVPGQFMSKQMQIIRELVPAAAKIAILSNPGNAIHRKVIAEELPQTAKRLGIALLLLEATTAEEIDTAFASAAAQQVDAILPLGDPLAARNRARVTALAAKHRLPAIYLGREYVTEGGLISYSPDFPDLWRRAGSYIDRILKGTKPSDLPVEQPAKFELVSQSRQGARANRTAIYALHRRRADRIGLLHGGRGGGEFTG